MAKHTTQDLMQLQALPLSIKIRMTQNRLREWIGHYGTTGVYVSFSGGKDSTVLLHLVREIWPNVPAVFCDTGLEFPEIRDFVRTFDNVEWLKPKMNFRQVIEKYGYPFISKEVSQTVWEVREALKKGKTGPTYRMRKLNGEVVDKKTGKLSVYNIPQWKFLLDAPIDISHMCCNVMKKGPAHDYAKRTGRKPITAQMASESWLRAQKWLQNGCNAFNLKSPISNPLSFWTEQDVLQYIHQNHIPIASVYGDVVIDYESMGQIEGQMSISDFSGNSGFFDLDRPILKTTGYKRTGCTFCAFGAHLEKPGCGRFERLKETHSKLYEYIMRPWDDGGLGYKEIIDWINENNGKGTIIRY